MDCTEHAGQAEGGAAKAPTFLSVAAGGAGAQGAHQAVPVWRALLPGKTTLLPADAPWVSCPAWGLTSTPAGSWVPAIVPPLLPAFLLLLQGNRFDKYGGASNLAELNALLKNRQAGA